MCLNDSWETLLIFFVFEMNSMIKVDNELRKNKEKITNDLYRYLKNVDKHYTGFCMWDREWNLHNGLNCIYFSIEYEKYLMYNDPLYMKKIIRRLQDTIWYHAYGTTLVSCWVAAFLSCVTRFYPESLVWLLLAEKSKLQLASLSKSRSTSSLVLFR